MYAILTPIAINGIAEKLSIAITPKMNNRIAITKKAFDIISNAFFIFVCSFLLFLKIEWLPFQASLCLPCRVFLQRRFLFWFQTFFPCDYSKLRYFLCFALCLFRTLFTKKNMLDFFCGQIIVFLDLRNFPLFEL